jgi:hypothetical protein
MPSARVGAGERGCDQRALEDLRARTVSPGRGVEGCWTGPLGTPPASYALRWNGHHERRGAAMTVGTLTGRARAALT